MVSAVPSSHKEPTCARVASGPSARTANAVSNLGDGVTLVAGSAASLTRDPRLVAGLAVAQRLPGRCSRWSAGYNTGWTAALADGAGRRRPLRGRRAARGGRARRRRQPAAAVRGVLRPRHRRDPVRQRGRLHPARRRPQGPAARPTAGSSAPRWLPTSWSARRRAAAVRGRGRGAVPARRRDLRGRAPWSRPWAAGSGSSGPRAPPQTLRAEIAEGARWLARHRLLRVLAAASR